MPLMPLSQTRVVDQVLTNLSHGYTNNEYIALRLAPPVAVDEYGGTTITFDRSTIRNDSYDRAPGSEFKQVKRTYTGNPYKLKNKGLKFPVPMEHQKDSEKIGIEWDFISNEDMMERLMLEHEIEAAGLITDDTLYPTANKTTLSGASQWNDPSSTPAADIRAAKSAIKKSAGMKGNRSALVLWLGSEVMDQLMEHPTLMASIKGDGEGPITEEMLANYFRIDRVIVGEAVYSDTPETAGTETFVWGKYAGLVAVNRAGLDGGVIAPSGNINRYTPSFAYTYTMTQDGVVHPYQYPVHWNEDIDAWEYKMRYDRSVELTGIESGFLFSDAVA